LATSDGNNSRPRRFFDRGMALACGVILLSGMLILLYLFNPLTSGIFPPCPFHYLTGMHCPGCGSLRAVHKILHGDLAGALAMNPLLVLSLPLFPVAVFRRSWLYLSWLPLTFLLIILLFGVLRNIPLWPFMLLAPH
jgi:hypothetical protein